MVLSKKARRSWERLIFERLKDKPAASNTIIKSLEGRGDIDIVPRTNVPKSSELRGSEFEDLLTDLVAEGRLKVVGRRFALFEQELSVKRKPVKKPAKKTGVKWQTSKDKFIGRLVREIEAMPAGVEFSAKKLHEIMEPKYTASRWLSSRRIGHYVGSLIRSGSIDHLVEDVTPKNSSRVLKRKPRVD